jgi:hypothetical protein
MLLDNFTNGAVHGARGHTLPLDIPGTHYKNIFIFVSILVNKQGAHLTKVQLADI